MENIFKMCTSKPISLHQNKMCVVTLSDKVLDVILCILIFFNNHKYLILKRRYISGIIYVICLLYFLSNILSCLFVKGERDGYGSAFIPSPIILNAADGGYEHVHGGIRWLQFHSKIKTEKHPFELIQFNVQTFIICTYIYLQKSKINTSNGLFQQQNI